MVQEVDQSTPLAQSAHRVDSDQALILSVFGADSVQMAKKTTDKAVAREQAGDFKGADELFAQSVKIADARHADEDLPDILNKYAKLKGEEGDTKGAEQLKKRADLILQKSELQETFLANARNGAAPDVMAGQISQLAAFDGQNGDPANADRLYKMSVKMVEDQDGRNSKALIPILQSYEQFEQSQGKVDFALHDRIEQLTANGDPAPPGDPTQPATPIKKSGSDPATDGGLKQFTPGQAGAAGTGDSTKAQGGSGAAGESTYSPYEALSLDLAPQPTPGDMPVNAPQTNFSAVGSPDDIGKAAGKAAGLAAAKALKGNPSEDDLLRNLSLTSEVFGSSSTPTADMATTVANFYNKKGPNYASSADAFSRQALAILDPTDPANDVLRGNTLTAFGKALRQEATPESADQAETNARNFNHIADAKFSVALDVGSNSWKEYTPEVSKLAQAYASAGEYGKADETFQQAIRIHHESLQGGEDEATAVEGADVVYLRYADFLKANGRGDEATYYQNVYAQEHKAAQ